VSFGEDVGFYGGVFRVTEGLQQKHGDQRVFDAPIAEGGMLAVAIGMGAYGLRPVVEIQFADYIYPATDQLVSAAARLRYRSGGEFWSAHPQSEVPDGHYTVPLGQAAIVREGDALTVLVYGTMVHVALAAAEEAQIDAEIIDLRTLLPLDIETITASVEKTGRCVIAH